jgi:rhomboid family GlyGly-CTERM serine protease
MNPTRPSALCDLEPAGASRRSVRGRAGTDASARRPYLSFADSWAEGSQESWPRKIIPGVTEALRHRPELLGFIALLALFNAPILAGSCFQSMVFLPQAVQSGEWWRLLCHPFVHVTWYHLLLDGTAFLALYYSLIEASLLRRVLYVVGGAAGSVLVSWVAAPAISSNGLCGLSGIAHGLMAVSALELVAGKARGSAERRIGQLGFILVVGKAALEALSGRMFFTFLHFGLMGDPVAVSHAGGILGSLLAVLALKSRLSGAGSDGSPRRPLPDVSAKHL